MDNQDKSTKIHEERNATLASIDQSLQSMVLLQMAEEFYSKEERKALYIEFNRLLEEDHALYLQLRDDSVTVTDKEVVLEKKGEIRQAQDDVRNKHPILWKIMDAKRQLGRFHWE